MTEDMRGYIKEFLDSPFGKEYVAKVFVRDGDMDTRYFYFTSTKPFAAEMVIGTGSKDTYRFDAVEIGRGETLDDKWVRRLGPTLREVKPEEL